MRKLLILFLFVTLSLLASSRVLLELKPSINGAISEYRVVKSLPGKSKSQTFLKGSKDIGDYNYIIQYDSENWVYYCPRPAEDTFAVRFVPPARCSLVAFTWIGYNTETGAVGAPVDVFVHLENPLVDYSTYPGIEEYDGTEFSPLGRLLWSGTSSAPANAVWDTVNIDPGVAVGDTTFFCGYSGVNPLDTIACLCESWRPMPNPIDVHTYQFNADGAGGSRGWFAYYYTSQDEALHAGIRAYVFAYFPPIPIVDVEKLPYSYTTEKRKVNINCYYLCGMTEPGFEKVILYYSVNGGSEDSVVSLNPVSGDSMDGIWQVDIPWVLVGDTVDYYVVGKTYNDKADTSQTYTYAILEGTPGNFLYIKNDNDPADIFPDYWMDTCDFWDFEEYGNPDSSVITFYNTVVWRDWGCLSLGRGVNYGVGIYHSDSSWIKMVLDNGGNFWLSDQDMGYGLGICPGYGQQVVPSGHWVREYLGIKGMYDDGSLSGSPVTVFGDSLDLIIGDLFKGIGHQNQGELYIHPEQHWVGNFDSLANTATTNMSAYGGEIVSYRWTGPSDNYKVYLDFYPFDYIKNPSDTTEIDRVAVDSLVKDVLGWFGYTTGVRDRTIEPGEVIKLLPVGIVTDDALIKFFLPGEAMVSLSIYDNTGRLIKNLKSGIASAGLNTVRWEGKDSYGNSVTSGIYFCQLRTSDRTLTNKFVVIK